MYYSFDSSNYLSKMLYKRHTQIIKPPRKQSSTPGCNIWNNDCHIKSNQLLGRGKVMSTKAETAKREDYIEQGKDTESIESLLSQAQKKLERVAALQNKKKILLVDDNAYIRDVLGRLLELQNFKVVTAEDGRSGIEASEDMSPDLIITDIEMPRLDGVGMIKALRSQSKFNQVPILAITAYGHWAEARAIEAGADRAMVKPIEPDMLFECIEQLLNAPNH